MPNKTGHAEEYITAWQSSRIHDMRSLTAHWEAGYKFAEYGDRPVDIAEDIGVSVSTIYNHIQLYAAFSRVELLLRAAAKAGHYNYQILARESLGLPPKTNPSVRVWQCSHCGSRELERVS